MACTQVDQAEFLKLFENHKDSKGKQAKLKSPDELAAFLEGVRSVQQSLDAAAAARDAASSGASAGEAKSVAGEAPAAAHRQGQAGNQKAG